MEHMPLINPKKPNYHLFLAIKYNNTDKYWYKANVNIGKGNMRNWLDTMAKRCGIVGNIINKSGKVISITFMLVAKMLLETIAQIIEHRNLKTLSRYNRIAILKAKIAQKLLR